MKCKIEGKPSFSYIEMTLDPGQSIVAESDAMVSMDVGIDMKTKFNGGFFTGLARKFFGGETLFINTFTNKASQEQKIVFTQPTPGDIHQIKLDGEDKFIQPGAYLCSTEGISIKIKWAGFKSFIAREGLFRLLATGKGYLWIGAYGHIYEKEIDGEYLVDTSHLVAYDPSMSMHLQLSGGLISSMTSGEGFLTRMNGKGTLLLQSRSLSGLASYLNPRI
tara:strand:- start:4084 stop:4743 length:660 start_codon:yes stop_codon:yes gene_type:complete